MFPESLKVRHRHPRPWAIAR